MKLWLNLSALALLASCSSPSVLPEEAEESAYTAARNQACLLEAQQSLQFGKYAESLAAFRRWSGPVTDPVVHLTLARAYLGMGDRLRARAALEAAAALAPDSAPLQGLLARFDLPLIPAARPAADEVKAALAAAPKGFVTLE